MQRLSSQRFVSSVKPSQNASTLPPAIARPQARTLVTMTVLGALIDSPVGAAGVERFTFQRTSDCVSHSRNLKHNIAADLKQQGVVIEVPPKSGLRAFVKRVTQIDLSASRPATSAQQLAELCDTHGPVSLILQGLIAPGQGDDVYQLHHSVVMLGSFVEGGRTIGVLMDPNNLQTNKVMSTIKQWREDQGLLAPLHEMTKDQMSALDKWLGDQQPPMAFGQVAFGLVDLQAAVERSDALYVERSRFNDHEAGMAIQPNRVEFDPDARVVQPLLTHETVERLRQEIRHDPTIVTTSWDDAVPMRSDEL
ncbi:MAG: hypothetical protein KF871_08985 [Hydrogenophaga sp.]|uniref:hypothetical protein n=1 Tax=Hydrogenophaga sp. TaxID=1904254 RepID=UPI001DC59022|nr:hypothetical protein [Hydrogenophaga sp.]MBX3610021.1 hypothetical protein [Hydrogenophaga sp.]